MVAYSFKKRFAPLIDSNLKLQTIRAGRRRHARPGEDLQLYTGMRTKQCRLVARRRCKAVTPVKLGFRDGVLISVLVGDRELSIFEMIQFARDDGFGGETDCHLEEMAAFWMQEHPQTDPDYEFEGVLIEWHPGD